jgi:hypothetical protein
MSAKIYAKIRAAERAEREVEDLIHRVCEALSGTCVMAHECKDRQEAPFHERCSTTNCAAYRAAFDHHED